MFYISRYDIHITEVPCVDPLILKICRKNKLKTFSFCTRNLNGTIVHNYFLVYSQFFNLWQCKYGCIMNPFLINCDRVWNPCQACPLSQLWFLAYLTERKSMSDSSLLGLLYNLNLNINYSWWWRYIIIIEKSRKHCNYLKKFYFSPNCFFPSAIYPTTIPSVTIPLPSLPFPLILFPGFSTFILCQTFNVRPSQRKQV